MNKNENSSEINPDGALNEVFNSDAGSEKLSEIVIPKHCTYCGDYVRPNIRAEYLEDPERLLCRKCDREINKEVA